MSQSEDYLSKNLEALENETNKDPIEDRDDGGHQPEQDRIEEALKEAVEGQPIAAHTHEQADENSEAEAAASTETDETTEIQDSHLAHPAQEPEEEHGVVEQPPTMADEISGLDNKQAMSPLENEPQPENGTDRLLDRINKQKDIVARDLDEETEDPKSRALSDTMEQAWQHVDQNVQRLTGNENQPVYHPPQSYHRYLPPHDYSAQDNLTAWNSTPEQIGGRALMVPQLNLAEQIQMPEMLNKQGFTPPQIPNMGEWQGNNGDVVQSGEIFDHQGNAIHDPIYTPSETQPEKSQKQVGSRFLGIGAVIGVIGAGSIYYYGGVDNLKTDFERISGIAGIERIAGSKDEGRLDLAQQTIKSEARPESRDTGVGSTLGGKSQIAAHDAAIEAKIRGDNKDDAPGDMQPNLLAASVKSGQPKFKFAIDNITGPAGRNLALNINLNAQQKAATTNLVFYGVPGEINMSAGERVGRTWIVPRGQLDQLSLISDPEFQGPVDLEVELQNNNTSISERAKLAVNIGPFSETIVAEAGETQNVIRGTSVVAANEVNKTIRQQSGLGSPVVGENANALAKVKPVRSQPKRISAALESGLLKRGKDFMSVGDFASARLAFEHLATSGHAGGAVALAETFDPQFLVANEARGLQGDIEQALKWYRHAVSLGHEEAMARVRELELELQ